MKRLAIYVYHDPKGEVREYVFFCLDRLGRVVDRILFVVNGHIKNEYREKLKALGIGLLVRENKGFDFQGWKEGLEFIGYDRLAEEYDELLLTNNSYYGPMYPFSEMWAAMDKRECDFWGITRHPELPRNFIQNNPRTRLTSHIQTYWVVFKKRILQTKEFRRYWLDLPLFASLDEAVGLGEIQLTRHFEGLGFTAATYLDEDDRHKTDPCFFSDTLIMTGRCPVLKRKFFYGFKDHLIACRNDHVTARLLEFLKDRTQYDVDMIWDDLLATRHMSTINEHLHLNYILPACCANAKRPGPEAGKIALILYIYYETLIEYCKEYAAAVPDHADIFVVCASGDVLQKCKSAFSRFKNKVEYRMQPNRGRDNAALLVTCRDVAGKYDYICFAHSKKSAHAGDAGDAFRDHCYTSLLHNRHYVENILTLFNENKRLGLLIPFPPVAFGYFRAALDEWGPNRENAERFLRHDMSLDISLDPHVMAPFGGMFWARAKALESLLSREWRYDDFPEEPLKATDGQLAHTLERVIPLLAQHDGFYTAWAAPDFYAGATINNLFYWMRKIYGKRVISKNLYNDAKRFRIFQFRYMLWTLAAWLSWGRLRRKFNGKRRKIKEKLARVTRAARL